MILVPIQIQLDGIHQLDAFVRGLHLLGRELSRGGYVLQRRREGLIRERVDIYLGRKTEAQFADLNFRDIDLEI